MVQGGSCEEGNTKESSTTAGVGGRGERGEVLVVPGWVRVGWKSYWFMETKLVGMWGGNPLAGRPLLTAPEPGQE